MKDRLSWWEYECFVKDIDYTIIGGGIVGLSTAIELKKEKPDAKVLVIDKKTLPIGASTKNAGFACFGSISEILDDYNLYGEKICEKLIKMRWQGLSILKSRIPAKKMKYEPKSGAEVFESREKEQFYIKELPWVNSFISPIVESEDCFFESRGRFGFQVVNRLEGSLNPQMMMNELELTARKKGVIFLSGVEVKDIDIENKYLSTNRGGVNYNNLIVCTNGFSRSLFTEMDILPARNQVLITNRIPGFSLGHCFHMNKGYVYFREYDSRLLIGGGRDLDVNGETTDQLETTDIILSYLKNLVEEFILPGVTYNIEHSWSGILGVGDSKLPIVKKINDDAVVAIRMGGMGVAVGSFIGKVAASMIMSTSNSANQLYVS